MVGPYSFKGETMSKLLENLNLEQQQAVTHKNGPLLIVAGAGTGKTTVVTRRLAWLVENKLAKTEEILTLTFTDKASQELEERIDQLLPYGFLDLWIHTFHSFCERILKQHCLEIGLPGDFKLLTQTESWLLVRENLEKFDLDYYKPLGNPTKFIHALLKHFSRCKDEMIFPSDYLQYAESLVLDSDLIVEGTIYDEKKKYQEIANAYHTYNQLLLDNNALDFGDLIAYTLKLFKERPQILNIYRQQFKYILVDEFQDTNLAQYELIKLLAMPQNNLTVVGDDDQSIYKFRGAAISNILHFKNDFPEATLIALISNYRSRQNILDHAYKVISYNNPDRLEVKLNINKKLSSQNKTDGLIEVIKTRTGEEEAKKVAEKIQFLKIQEEERGSYCTWNDFAILIRSNSEADLFTLALDKLDIPFQFLASSGLYRQELVLDIIAYLKLLDNYHENGAMYRILSSSFINLDFDDLVKINYQSKKKTQSIFETLKTRQVLNLTEKSLEKIDNLLRLIDKHTQLAKNLPTTSVVYGFLNDTGYLKNLVVQNNEGSIEAAKQIMFLKQFYNTIEKFEVGHAEKKVKNFLDFFNYLLDSGEEGALERNISAGPEAVKIMTLHSAKGLEFKYIFLVNLVEMKFPSVSRAEPIELPDKLIKEILPSGDAHLQEERRLFYVGATRAKDGLFLTLADNYGGVRKRKPSRFIQEMGLPTAEINEVTEQEFLNDVKQEKPRENQPQTLIGLPSTFSFTQLKTFSTCPRQYRFAHILHIPTKGNASFSFGKTIHLTLQKFYQQIINLNSVSQGNLFGQQPMASEINTIQVPSLEELLNFYEESWIDEWYLDKNQKKEYFEKGKKILRTFYETTNWKIPKMLEVGFNLRFGEIKLKGQIDRIDCLPDGSVEIIDYKTGSAKEDSKLTSEDKEQLLIYQLAAEKFFKEKPSLLTFYYLDGNSKVSFIGSNKELTKLEEKIIKQIAEIKQSDFPAKPSSFICSHCDFKDICDVADLS